MIEPNIIWTKTINPFRYQTIYYNFNVIFYSKDDITVTLSNTYVMNCDGLMYENELEITKELRLSLQQMNVGLNIEVIKYLIEKFLKLQIFS